MKNYAKEIQTFETHFYAQNLNKITKIFLDSYSGESVHLFYSTQKK
jgi:hypothetical protein